jgi:4-amino-4-deoxy-L-arabinose transferase-like glycosyltransferase
MPAVGNQAAAEAVDMGGHMQALDPALRTRVMLLVAAVIVICAAFVSSGLYIIDEFVILASAKALYAESSLAIRNGYEIFHSDSLKLWLFAQGPHGLTSQYPVGSTVLGALLMDWFGVRGLILVNAVAAAATLFATRQLGRQLFADDDIGFAAVVLLAFGTFFLEFAFGIWPHATSTLAVTCALLFTVRALDADAAGAAKWALLSGLSVGAGFMFRLDTILVLAPIAVSTILYARHPVRSLMAVAAGLVPAVVAMSLVNQYKFGTYNPISYGRTGLTDVSSHVAAIGICALAVSGLFAFRYAPWRRLPRRWLASIAGATLLLALALSPSLRAGAWQFLRGSWAILVDASFIRDPRSGVGSDANGVVYFWGFVKKALAQSMPWLGVLSVWIGARRDDRQNRALVVAAVTLALWAPPFLYTAWHGGLGSNMRYFLPMLPLLCVVAAAAWFQLLAMTGGRSRMMAPAAMAVLAMIALWTLYGPSGLAGVQQIASTYLFLAALIACALVHAGWSRGRWTAEAAQFLVVAGLVMAILFGILDLHASQTRRSNTARISSALSVMPPRSLVFGPPELFTFQLDRKDGLIALTASTTSDELDLGLMRAAARQGYGVYVPPPVAVAVTRALPEFVVGPTVYRYPGGGLVQVSLRKEPGGDTDPGSD